MSPKSFIWVGMTVGGFIGGYVPSLWGADAFSMSGLLGTTIGGLLGIWLGFRLSEW